MPAGSCSKIGAAVTAGSEGRGHLRSGPGKPFDPVRFPADLPFLDEELSAIVRDPDLPRLIANHPHLRPCIERLFSPGGLHVNGHSQEKDAGWRGAFVSVQGNFTRRDDA